MFCVCSCANSFAATIMFSTKDAEKRISESYNFLKDREPEMTEDEYVLYERVIPMVFSQPDFALTMLETMLADDQPESPAFSYVLANVYYSQQRYADAENYYKIAIEEFPQFLRAWINLGILYYTQDEYEKAVPCFSKAITLGNQEGQILGLLGQCFLETNNPIAAEAAFMQAMVADPSNKDWIEALFNLYFESQQYTKAETLIKRLIKLNPDDAQNWKVYASILLQQNRDTEAISVLELASQLGITTVEDELLLAGIYAENKLFPEALGVYQSVMSKNPDLGSNYALVYVRALTHEKSYAKAEQVLRSVEMRLPDDKRVRFLQIKADLQSAQSLDNEAADTLEQLLKLDPLNGRALLAIGGILKKQGKIEDATISFDLASRSDESAFQAYVELANIALEQRQFRKGIQLLEAALRVEDHPELQKYLEKIRKLLPQKESK